MLAKQKMKAVIIRDFRGIDAIEIGEMPIPEPQNQEVQIEVHYAGINPVDWKITEGVLQSRIVHELPIILGWDVAGVVVGVGSEVSHLKVGDEVYAYCRKNIVHDGSYAEYICLEANHVVKKPKNLSFAEASCIPLSALTAWQSLFDTAQLQANEKVLIQSGAGGVGNFAIQFAKWAGAYVITTASHANSEYVTSLGADDVIDYTSKNFVEHIKKTYPEGIDVVYDTQGGDVLKASYGVLTQGGRLVTITGIVDNALAQEHNVRADYVLVTPNGEQLQKIAELLETSKIQCPKIEEIPFEEIKSALRKSREGHTRGKMVLKVKD